MSEAIEQILKQAEAQKLQIELNLLYNQNLALFKERFPTIHKKFEGHTPENVVLQLDPNGQINLVDKTLRQYIYNENPSEFCKKQVEAFGRDQKVRKFRVTKSDEINKRHLHIRHLNELIDEYQETEVKRIKKTTYISNLMMTGVGLGYQIHTLIEKFDIQNLFIYEYCLDTFHASLHTLDWKPILDYFQENGRSITFCLGVTPVRALEQIEASMKRIGLFSQIYTFVYRHTMRKTEAEFIDTYINEIRAYVGGLGFYDDEQIGIAHAYKNLINDNATFISKKTHRRKTRLLLIGNGPSLDYHQDYIKKNKDNAIIMSCGTAIGSLLRMGIKPDFHIEMERCMLTHDYLLYDASEEERKGITLLCLHAVSPIAISAFDEVCYAIKPNDAGSSLVHEYYLPQKLQELPFCNPTVTNCGLAFGVSMGFMDIHLIGVDFGISKDGKHHSEKSVYYDIEKHVDAETDFKCTYSEDDIYLEGNFGGEVKTHNILNVSRVSMERLLKIIQEAFPDFKCINSNDGAKINYAKPCQLADIQDCAETNKQQELSRIKSDHFYYYRNKAFEKKSPKYFLKHFYEIKEKVKLTTKINTEKELLVELKKCFDEVSRDKDLMTHFLFRGSMNCFFGCIVENSLYCKDDSDFKDRVAIGVSHYNTFVDKVYEQMESDPFRIDDSQDPTLKKFQQCKQPVTRP